MRCVAHRYGWISCLFFLLATFFSPLIPISGHLRLIWKPVSRISYDLELNVSLYSQSNKPHMLTFTLMHFFIHVPLCYSMKIEPVDVYTVCRFEKWYSLFGTDSSHGSWNKEWSFLESTFKDFNSVKHIFEEVDYIWLSQNSRSNITSSF